MPSTAAVTEPARMAALAARTSNSAVGKARPLMRIDIVKPMPPRMPTPAIMCQLTLRGNWQALSLTRANVMPKIPIGLPSSMPKYTPSVTGSVSNVLISTPTRRTCAFTNAKIGRITKLTGVEIRRSMRMSGGVTRCMTRSTLVVETVKSCWPKMCASSS